MVFETTTLAEAWEQSMVYALSSYKKAYPPLQLIPTERGANAIEVENVLLKISKPLADDRISQLYPNNEYLVKYSKQLLDQSYHNQVYSRMTILRDASGKIIDQQADITIKLRESWYSRRAVISIWNPPEDIHSEHPPCICLLQFYVRSNKLCLTSFYRSNDAWLCAPADMIAITDVQKKVADGLSIPIGTYSHFAVSYHIYDYDIQAALNIFKEFL
jgi:thymidylate synthase (methanogen type)